MAVSLLGFVSVSGIHFGVSCETLRLCLLLHVLCCACVASPLVFVLLFCSLLWLCGEMQCVSVLSAAELVSEGCAASAPIVLEKDESMRVASAQCESADKIFVSELHASKLMVLTMLVVLPALPVLLFCVSRQLK